MTNLELVLCSLGEATATVYHRNRDSQGFSELKKDASDAGRTAGKARRVIEEDIAQSIVSSKNHLEPKNVKGKQTKEHKRLKDTSIPTLFDEIADRDA